jgi:hypothetical protein
MFSGTRQLVKELGISGPVGCVDGSQIIDSGTGALLASFPLSREGLERAARSIRAHQLASFVFVGDRLHSDRNGERFSRYTAAWTPDQVRVDDVLDIERWNPTAAVSCLLCIGAEEAIRTCTAELEHTAHASLCVLTFQMPFEPKPRTWGMLVRAAHVTKGSAIRWIAEYHRVSLEETIAIGDWLNDIPMLRIAGRSFAMAQSDPSVKAAASDILEANDVRGAGIHESAARAGLL